MLRTIITSLLLTGLIASSCFAESQQSMSFDKVQIRMKDSKGTLEALESETIKNECIAFIRYAKATLKQIDREHSTNEEISRDSHSKHLNVMKKYQALVSQCRDVYNTSKQRHRHYSSPEYIEYKQEQAYQRNRELRALTSSRLTSVGGGGGRVIQSGGSSDYMDDAKYEKIKMEAADSLGNALDQCIQAYMLYLNQYVEIESQPEFYNKLNNKKMTEPMKW